jgi:hypothetical protein
MSTDQKIEKRFIFRGNAVAFAAHIRRPFDLEIPAVASSCLPVTGGLATAEAGNATFQSQSSQGGSIFSFTSASTRATGDYTDKRRAIDFTHGNFGDNELSTVTLVEAKMSGFTIHSETPGAAPSFSGRPAGKNREYVRPQGTECFQRTRRGFQQRRGEWQSANGSYGDKSIPTKRDTGKADQGIRRRR